MGKIRLAIISQSLNIGGGETMAARLAGYVDNNKFNVKLFIISSYKENQISSGIREANVNYQCLDLPTSFNIKSYLVFAEALNAFKPDIVHVHLDISYSWIWSILHNKPLVVTMHGDPFVQQADADKRVLFLTRLKAKQGNLKVIGCARIIRDLAQQKYHLPEKCLGYIYNPIAAEKYYVSKKENDEICFVNVGRFHYLKNQELLVSAFKEVHKSRPYSKLFFAGVGPTQNSVKQLVKTLNLENAVEFLNNVEDVPSLLSRMDIFVLSSLSEACPIVILEAMAAGLPIISTNVGGVSELVKDNGILVQSDDKSELIRAMVNLIDNRESRDRMALRSLEYIKRFDKSNVVEEYQCVYSQMVKR